MKTILHNYSYRLPQDKTAYEAMKHEIRNNGIEGRGKRFHAFGSYCDYDLIDKPTEVEIDPSYLFENQWNTTVASGNRRLFDWAENYVPNRSDTKRGHWLEITPEMVDARKQCRKCGYCGKHYGPLHEPIPGEFCTACLDSPYLKDSELHLLRLLPLVGLQTREKLSELEAATLKPIYVARQTTGADRRNAQKLVKQRAGLHSDYAKAVDKATNERDGKLWLMDHNLSIDNVIYYSHTGKFCFGWMQPVSNEVASKLLDVISEFPFPYTIKSESRTYERE